MERDGSKLPVQTVPFNPLYVGLFLYTKLHNPRYVGLFLYTKLHRRKCLQFSKDLDMVIFCFRNLEVLL